ncbi:hypothetical protein OGAPHI_006049 [Ogataea philodendri]|uniref:Uncharacterized protein n=1 Tax=Ogataea philodendri TaxID=1378263 RepID=A0A9P8NYK5_9ASCO|nr:uncharacterized protein OGAPHI_006049 [Ogataea philodendri]KAH3661870.1 hypothetical protein OGAPHI_006049 [Ogataea philodendri]
MRDSLIISDLTGESVPALLSDRSTSRFGIKYLNISLMFSPDVPSRRNPSISNHVGLVARLKLVNWPAELKNDGCNGCLGKLLSLGSESPGIMVTGTELSSSETNLSSCLSASAS